MKFYDTWETCHKHENLSAAAEEFNLMQFECHNNLLPFPYNKNKNLGHFLILKSSNKEFFSSNLN